MISVSIMLVFNREAYIFDSKTLISVSVMLVFNREAYIFDSKPRFL